MMKLKFMDMPIISLTATSNGVLVSIGNYGCAAGKVPTTLVFNDIGYGSIGGDDGHETLVSWLMRYYQDNEDKDAKA